MKKMVNFKVKIFVLSSTKFGQFLSYGSCGVPRTLLTALLPKIICMTILA